MLVEFKSADPVTPAPTPPVRDRSVGARLLAALHALAGGQGELLEHRQSPWASVTFSGTRHELALRFAGSEALAAGEEFIAALPEHEFTIPRQLVADAAVIAVDHVLHPAPLLDVRCELLLLDEC